jgi:hypothetical protein
MSVLGVTETGVVELAHVISHAGFSRRTSTGLSVHPRVGYPIVHGTPGSER